MLSACSDAKDGILCDDYAGAGIIIYLCTASDVVAFSKKSERF